MDVLYILGTGILRTVKQPISIPFSLRRQTSYCPKQKVLVHWGQFHLRQQRTPMGRKIGIPNKQEGRTSEKPGRHLQLRVVTACSVSWPHQLNGSWLKAASQKQLLAGAQEGFQVRLPPRAPSHLQLSPIPSPPRPRQDSQ